MDSTDDTFSSERVSGWAEVHLTEDTLVHMDGHKLRIAELGVEAKSAPTPPVDPGQPYTSDMARRDLRRVAMAMVPEEYTDEDVEEMLPAAALLLSKLYCFRLGAPPESEGHQHARQVFESAATHSTEGQ